MQNIEKETYDAFQGILVESFDSNAFLYDFYQLKNLTLEIDS